MNDRPTCMTPWLHVPFIIVLGLESSLYIIFTRRDEFRSVIQNMKPKDNYETIHVTVIYMIRLIPLLPSTPINFVNLLTGYHFPHFPCRDGV